MTSLEMERRRAEKLVEIEEDIAKLHSEQFKNLENVHKMERMLTKEIDLMKKATQKNLEAHLTTCNYAFYKSIINEIEETTNVSAVLKTFKRDEFSVTVDIVQNVPHAWIKLVNRPAKTVLIEYRDGKRNGDVIAQIKQHRHVSKRFNNPQIRVIFKKGILKEMADKLTRKGIVVIGEIITREHPDLRGKWNEELLERLAEDEDSDWGEEEDEIGHSPRVQLEETLPCLNLDISAVMLLVSNMCEQGGAQYHFVEEMINKHVASEREKPAKQELLKKLNGHQLIMSELAYQRVAQIVSEVGGPTEKLRFRELSESIRRIPDQESNECGRVAKLAGIRGITQITKRVFSCAELTHTTTVTANQKFLTHSRAKNVYFNVIEIPPRPLTEQKEAKATLI